MGRYKLRATSEDGETVRRTYILVNSLTCTLVN